MQSNTLLLILVTVVCAFFVYRHLGVVLRFLFPRHVKHGALEGFSAPTHGASDVLTKNGFAFLGVRVEQIAYLWRYRAFVFVRQGTVVADVGASNRLRSGYLASFWQDGRFLLTVIGGHRDIETPTYRSQCASAHSPFAQILNVHLQTAADLNAKHQAKQQVVETMETRLQLAETWYAHHARKALKLDAIMGAVLMSTFGAFWIYALVLLT